MIIASQYLDLPLRRSEEELQRFLAEAPGNILVKYRDPASLGRRIRTDLLRLAPEQWPDADRLARQLCLSPSTLRRRLAEEGQNYQGLKDSVRRSWRSPGSARKTWPWASLPSVWGSPTAARSIRHFASGSAATRDIIGH